MPSPPSGTLPGLADELARVEAALDATVVTDDPAMAELATHIGRAGGKRLRPAMVVAAGACAPGADGPVDHDVILGGVAVELVHQGSLYHDDVIDEADTRHGVESVNARWGNLTAILAGDYLLAKASEVAASLGTEVAGLLARTIATLCEGEVRELRTAFQPDRSEEQYLAAISGKTASLFAASCRIGALVVELPRPEVEALTTFGHRLGMAFQVVDDILDVVAAEAEIGKPAGNDLASGIYTLPVLRALRSPTEGPELADLLGRPLDGPDVERARKLVRSGTGVDEALAVARAYGDEALAALAHLPQSPGAHHLAATVDDLLGRVPV